jgi:hypothetical protein
MLTSATPSSEGLSLPLRTTAKTTSRTVRTATTRSRTRVSQRWMQLSRYDGFWALSRRARFFLE